MTKDNLFDFYADWYDIWTKQSKEFFETANHHLADFFTKQTAFHPEDHLAQINAWLDNLKRQWDLTSFSREKASYQPYLTMMNKIFNEASELMIKKWIKLSEEHTPINSIVELYELWLDSCHEAYQKSMHTNTHQELYGDMMNSAIKFWKETMPK